MNESTHLNRSTEMKKSILLLLTMILTVSMLCAVPAFAEDTGDTNGTDPTGTTQTYLPQLGTNGKAALAYFGIQEDLVFDVSDTATSGEINKWLQEAKIDATADSPIMVYVGGGTHNLTTTINVPDNVVLVAEDTVLFKRSSAIKMVKLTGSMYGGTWDGGNYDQNIIQMVNTNTTGKNMTVMKAVIRNTKLDGVHINDSAVKHGKVLDNKITNCKHNGVSVYNGGQFDTISGNTISNIGNTSTKNGSAIDICSSNVTNISNNKISIVVGHGISTDPTSSRGKFGCKITNISGNTIKTVNHQGIYVEKKCSVSKLNNNKISNIQGCCLTVDKNAKVYSMSGNKFSGGKLAKKGKHSLMTLNGKGSYVKMGKKNTLSGGYAAGIALSKSAKLYITGGGNVITKNKNNGIQMAPYSVLKITGKTKITYNRWGINMQKRAKANIKRVTFRYNRKGAVYYIRGAKFKKSKCSVKGKIYKQK